MIFTIAESAFFRICREAEKKEKGILKNGMPMRADTLEKAEAAFAPFVEKQWITLTVDETYGLIVLLRLTRLGFREYRLWLSDKRKASKKET